MGELDFRKKRKNTNIRGTARKQGKNSRQRELRFENEKREKRSSGKRWGKNKKNTKGIVLWAVELLLVCMTAVFLVAAFGQRVNVIGDSMSPVLKNGNVVMINHFIYNIKDPSRGDIAAFQKDGDERYFVKRIVGLPGETVQIKEGKLLIDGKPLKQSMCRISDMREQRPNRSIWEKMNISFWEIMRLPVMTVVKKKSAILRKKRFMVKFGLL